VNDRPVTVPSFRGGQLLRQWAEARSGWAEAGQPPREGLRVEWAAQLVARRVYGLPQVERDDPAAVCLGLAFLRLRRRL